MTSSEPNTNSDPEQASAADEKQPSTIKVIVRRLIVAILLIVLILIPVVIMALLSHEPSSAGWAAMGALIGLVAVAVAGVRVGVITAIVTGLLTPVAVVAGETAITGAALMALLCLLIGRLSRFDLHRATLLVPIFMAWVIISPPPWGPNNAPPVRTDETYLAWMAAFFFVGAIFPVLVVPLIKKKAPPRPAPHLHTRQESVPYTVSITVLATVATYWALADPKQWAGAFLIATILVLTQIGGTQTLKPTVYRVLGTLLGSIIVLLVVTQLHSLGLIYLVGAVMGVAAIMSKFGGGPGWIYFIFMTPTAVCLNAYSVPEVAELGRQRLFDNVVGGVLVLVAAAVTIGYSHWQQRNGATLPEPSTDEFELLAATDPR